MSVAFLFPGQCSQKVWMGKALAETSPESKAVFDAADAALGFSLSRLCFEGPESDLQLTANTQPAILTASLATLRALEARGVAAPAWVAGHSLGEYSAHVAAGTLDFADAVRIVRNRGSYMQMAVPAGQGAMAAVLGLSLEEIEAACREAASAAADQVVAPANINSPGQVVISGHAAAVERAAELVKQRGAKRAVMLPVSAPFHCALMQPAQERLASDLRAAAFHPMRVPLVTNVDAEVIESSEKARDALIRQVTGAVQWEKSMRALIAAGVETFVEVGPGKVLCGLMRQIDRAKTCLNVEDPVSLEKTLAQRSSTS